MYVDTSWMASTWSTNCLDKVKHNVEDDSLCEQCKIRMGYYIVLFRTYKRMHYPLSTGCTWTKLILKHVFVQYMPSISWSPLLWGMAPCGMYVHCCLIFCFVLSFRVQRTQNSIQSGEWIVTDVKYVLVLVMWCVLLLSLLHEHCLLLVQSPQPYLV